MHATHRDDISNMAIAIGKIYRPQDSAGITYRRLHPPPAHILASILKGTPGGSPQVFLDHLSRYLPRFEVPEWSSIIQFLYDIVTDARWDVALESSYIKAFCRSGRLIASLSSAVTAVAKTGSSRAGDDSALTVTTHSMRLISCIMLGINREWSEESDVFLRLCCRHGLFDVIEHVLAPELVNQNTLGKHRLLCTLNRED